MRGLIAICAVVLSGPLVAETLECDFEKRCGFNPNCNTKLLCLRSVKCQRERGFNFKIEYEEGSTIALFHGNNGTSEVSVHTGRSGRTFLEFLPTGTVQVTAVANSGQAVHSRQTMFSISPEIIPTQYYGHCEVSG